MSVNFYQECKQELRGIGYPPHFNCKIQTQYFLALKIHGNNLLAKTIFLDGICMLSFCICKFHTVVDRLRMTMDIFQSYLVNSCMLTLFIRNNLCTRLYAVIRSSYPLLQIFYVLFYFCKLAFVQFNCRSRNINFPPLFDIEKQNLL